MTETSGHVPPNDAIPADSDVLDRPSAEQVTATPQKAAGAEAHLDVAVLVEHARTGDHAAFDTLVTLYLRPVEVYLSGLTGDDEQARDLAQDVFWHAWNRLYELREPERFRAWLFRAATNRARSWLRRRRIVSWVSLEQLRGPRETAPQGGQQRPVTYEQVLPSAESGFEERMVETDALSRSLLRVPLDYRTCLLLHVSLGFSVREVADQLGTTPGAVRMRLHRGLAALREAYRDENA